MDLKGKSCIFFALPVYFVPLLNVFLPTNWTPFSGVGKHTEVSCSDRRKRCRTRGSTQQGRRMSPTAWAVGSPASPSSTALKARRARRSAADTLGPHEGSNEGSPLTRARLPRRQRRGRAGFLPLDRELGLQLLNKGPALGIRPGKGGSHQDGEALNARQPRDSSAGRRPGSVGTAGAHAETVFSDASFFDSDLALPACAWFRGPPSANGEPPDPISGSAPPRRYCYRSFFPSSSSRTLR